MSAASKRLSTATDWATALEEAVVEHPGHPRWLADIRKQGRERIRQHGFPSRAHEEWKYTSLAAIAQGPYSSLLDEGDQGNFTTVKFLPADGPVVTLLNGVFLEGSSDLLSLPAGIRVRPLSDALRGDADRLRSTLEAVSDGEHPFRALADATLGDGLFIEVDSGIGFEGVLHVVNLIDGGSAPGAAHLRHVVVVGKGARLAIVEEVHCHQDVLANIHWDFEVGEDAEVGRVRTFGRCADGNLFHGSRVRQADGSTFSDFFHCAGVRMIRNEIEVELAGRRCHTELRGAYFATGSEHVDNQTRILHSHPDCTSNEVYRGVLSGRSRGVFSGKIHVFQDAQRTDAKQSSDSLLLSRKAEADVRPRLEIYADDVRCTHGATVGELDEDAIFYLRSRGVNEPLARKMLVGAFVKEVLEEVEPEALRQRLVDDLTCGIEISPVPEA